MFDLAIIGGNVVLETGVVCTNLYIKDEKISKIDNDSSILAKEKYNAEGLYILPGGVDAHVHFCDPGYTDMEDFYTGSISAAAGGITTILEMPLTDPLTADKESFQIKRQEGEKKSIVDFGLYLALTPNNYKQVADLMNLKPVGFKAFMSYSPEIPMVDDGSLFVGMKALAAVGGRLALHCENNDIIQLLTNSLQQQNKNSGSDYAQSRPPFAEWESIQRAVNFAMVTGVNLHVVHSSTAKGAEIVKNAKQLGYSVSVETAPQYLLLNEDELEKNGPYAQCNPPLRDEENKEILWEYLDKGFIDCIASDHSPYTFEEKDAGKKNIWKSPAGITGIQTMVPMTISEGLKRKMSWNKLSQLLATNPAKLFGLYPKKGIIAIGSDADLVLYDPEEVWEVNEEDLLYKQPWTPYNTMKITGRIKRTLLRGKTIYVDDKPKGRITVKAGFGSFIEGKPTVKKGEISNEYIGDKS